MDAAAAEQLQDTEADQALKVEEWARREQKGNNETGRGISISIRCRQDNYIERDRGIGT